MTINEFFDRVNDKKCPKLNTGRTTFNNTIKVYYEQYIEPYLPEYKIIEAWHELLKGYYYGKKNNQSYLQIEYGAKSFDATSADEDKDVTINKADISACAAINPDDVLFIRRYASNDRSKTNNWDIRRGFLTRFYKGQNNKELYLQYVYVDNFFAQYFYAMAINGFVPSMQEFRDFIREREIPYGYLETESETLHQAYKKGKQYPLNNNGWKLSHMYSANEEDYDINGLNIQDAQGKLITKYQALCNTLFPKGVLEEYKYHNGSIFPYREDTTNFADWQIKIIKAHFIRVVHPINYFLTPKVAKHFFTNSNGKVTDIGEDSTIIEYVKYRIAKKYGKIFSEFKEMILADDRTKAQYSAPTGSIDIKFGMGVFNQKGAKVQFDDYYIAVCLYKFLFEGCNFTEINRTVLNCQNDRNYKSSGKKSTYNKASGFVHDIGLYTNDKGTLSSFYNSNISMCQCVQNALNSPCCNTLGSHLKEALDYINRFINEAPTPTPWQLIYGSSATGAVLAPGTGEGNNVASSTKSNTANAQNQRRTSQSPKQNIHTKINYDSSLITKTPAERETYLLNGVSDNYKNSSGLRKITEINAIVNSLFQGKNLFDLTNAQDIIDVWKEVKKQPWNDKTSRGVPAAIVSNYCVAVTGQAPRK